MGKEHYFNGINRKLYTISSLRLFYFVTNSNSAIIINKVYIRNKVIYTLLLHLSIIIFYTLC